MDEERGFKRVARWVMVVFLVASGIGHFAITDAYAAMVPASFPSPVSCSRSVAVNRRPSRRPFSGVRTWRC